MSRAIAIMQPTYLPWVGYLAMIEKADQFVFLDNVQFNHRSWQQRNRIKTPKGEEWLTISTITKGRSSQLIKDVECTNLDKDTKNHLSKIYHNYSNSLFFKEFYPEFSCALKESSLKCSNSLSLLNIEIIKFLCSYAGIKKEIVLASQISVTGSKDELLAKICEVQGFELYLSAPGSKNYIDESCEFSIRNIEILYHEYTHPQYPQLHGDFMEGMSCIDMFFNVEREKLKALIMSGCK